MQLAETEKDCPKVSVLDPWIQAQVSVPFCSQVFWLTAISYYQRSKQRENLGAVPHPAHIQGKVSVIAPKTSLEQEAEPTALLYLQELAILQTTHAAEHYGSTEGLPRPSQARPENLSPSCCPVPPPPTNTAYYPAISVSEQNRIRFLQIVTESGYGQQRHPAISSPKEQLLGHWGRAKAEHGPELSSCLLLGRCKDRACLWLLGTGCGGRGSTHTSQPSWWISNDWLPAFILASSQHAITDIFSDSVKLHHWSNRSKVSF